jgi:hypothetical protein
VENARVITGDRLEIEVKFGILAVLGAFTTKNLKKYIHPFVSPYPIVESRHFISSGFRRTGGPILVSAPEG